MSKERTIVEDWDGPVCVDDRYFEDLDEAVAWYWDDAWAKATAAIKIEDVPEFIECCESKFPTFDPDGLIEQIDENHLVNDDATSFSDHVSVVHAEKLKKLIAEWIESTGWKYWEGNNKFIQLRPLVEDYERESQRQDRLGQAMDYAGT